jgi:hypothetical protein
MPSATRISQSRLPPRQSDDTGRTAAIAGPCSRGGNGRPGGGYRRWSHHIATNRSKRASASPRCAR